MIHNGYRGLKVWTKAVDFVVMVYDLSSSFPRDERFGLTAQIRRAAVAVPSDIAEGHGRFTRGEFRNLLSDARGSLNEVETQSEIAYRLSFLDRERRDSLLLASGEVGRMITGLKRTLR